MSSPATERLLTLIAETYSLPVESISLDASFQELGIDSLGAMSVICDLENEFNIALPNEEVLAMRTVRQAVESLQRLVPGEMTDLQLSGAD
ncbi:hypothetical protein BH24GEM3_BH24GEM3_06930 [soil metagenome]